ncbi:uncharacterized protein LOC101235544 [Hydra vulgaris]|uniref:uncharacterized protein LOC101235544 n=1 Tax=Hydra vulgaris TaxID=6087 RepID=UPI0002B4C5CF|nr:uncharacterized protein LOC101235544 [Hydra vulgaris]
MDSCAAQKGLESTEKLYENFQVLLQSLGFERLLSKVEAEDQNCIPEKYEKTNQIVSELLMSMKDHLREIRTCYNTCRQEMLNHGHLLNINKFKMDAKVPKNTSLEKSKSVEYENLLQDLQEKNKKLEEMIHQMQDISSIINQLISGT